MAEGSAASNPFTPRTILLAIVAGVAAFAGFLVLAAYAPEWRWRGDGGAHAMSRSAVGFAGLYDLAKASGRPVALHNKDDGWGYSGLMIVTIQPNTDPEELTRLAAAQRATEGSVTLYILPKWSTAPLPTNVRWVQGDGTIDVGMLDRAMSIFENVKVREGTGGGQLVGTPGTAAQDLNAVIQQPLRYLEGPLDPMIEDASGRMVMGERCCESGACEYVLADPDLLSNKGLKSREGAAAALAIVDALRTDTEDSVAFDMVLVSGAEKRNLLRLMLEPPFLAFTLALAAALLLAGLHALGRFGPPRAEPRAIAFGKRALVDNAATLIGRARREATLGDRYVAAVRDAVGAALAAPARDPVALEAWLGRLPGDFARRAAAVRAARDPDELRVAAAALHDWKRNLVRDH